MTATALKSETYLRPTCSDLAAGRRRTLLGKLAETLQTERSQQVQQAKVNWKVVYMSSAEAVKAEQHGEHLRSLTTEFDVSLYALQTPAP